MRQDEPSEAEESRPADAETARQAGKKHPRTPKETIPEPLKAALWEAHGGRCVHTGTVLPNPGASEIDHILPEWLHDDPQELAAARERFNLPADFQVRGNPLNFVPTTPAFNRHKLGKMEEEETVSRIAEKWLRYVPEAEKQQQWKRPVSEVITEALGKAAEKLDEVRRLEARNTAAGKVAGSVRGVERERGVELDPESLAYVHDEMARLPTGFPEEKTQEEGTIRLARRRVRLNASLPSFPDLTGSVAIRFWDLTARDARLFLDHESVIARLLPGSETGVRSRAFIGPCEDSVTFSDVTLFLTKPSVDELVDLVDALAAVYVQPILKSERELFRSLRFPAAGKGYRIRSVPHWLWRAIYRFASHHRHGVRSSERDIFEVRGHSVAVVNEHPKEPLARTRCVLHAEWDRDDGSPSPDREPTASVWLCWAPGGQMGPGLATAERFRTGVAWNAEDVAAFLVEKLIPWAVEWDIEREARRRRDEGTWLMKLRRLGKPTPPPPSIEEIVEHTYSARVPDSEYPDSAAALTDYDQLRASVRQMQRFFGNSERVHGPVSALRGVCEFAEWCVSRFGLAPAEAAFALGRMDVCRGDAPPPGWLPERSGDAAPADEGYTSGHQFDWPLRALNDLLHKRPDSVTQQEVLEQAARHLREILTTYDALLYLPRLVKAEKAKQRVAADGPHTHTPVPHAGESGA